MGVPPKSSLRIKETYYGYAGALEQRRALQSHHGVGFLRDYFPWVKDDCMFDAAAALGVAPVTQLEAGRWTFNCLDVMKQGDR